MSLEFQLAEALEQTDAAMSLADPQNVEEAQAWGRLANNYETLLALADNPPPIASIWSAIPAIGLANIACPGGDCLELIDSEEGIYKQQCISGILSTTNPCSEYLDAVTALLSTMAAQLSSLGQHAAADVVQTAGDGVGNITNTSENVTRPTMGDLWRESPDWIKFGAAAAIALLLVKVLK
jgi:hypothetical protein